MVSEQLLRSPAGRRSARRLVDACAQGGRARRRRSRPSDEMNTCARVARPTSQPPRRQPWRVARRGASGWKMSAPRTTSNCSPLSCAFVAPVDDAHVGADALPQRVDEPRLSVGQHHARGADARGGEPGYCDTAANFEDAGAAHDGQRLRRVDEQLGERARGGPRDVAEEQILLRRHVVQSFVLDLEIAVDEDMMASCGGFDLRNLLLFEYSSSTRRQRSDCSGCKQLADDVSVLANQINCRADRRVGIADAGEHRGNLVLLAAVGGLGLFILSFFGSASVTLGRRSTELDAQDKAAGRPRSRDSRRTERTDDPPTRTTRRRWRRAHGHARTHLAARTRTRRSLPPSENGFDFAPGPRNCAPCRSTSRRRSAR